MVASNLLGKGRPRNISKGEEHMTFQEQIKALPEAERVKFFQGIMAVVEAGHKARVPPEELAKMYADTYKQVEKNI